MHRLTNKVGHSEQHTRCFSIIEIPFYSLIRTSKSPRIIISNPPREARLLKALDLDEDTEGEGKGDEDQEPGNHEEEPAARPYARVAPRLTVILVCERSLVIPRHISENVT